MIFDFIIATVLIYAFYRGYSKGFVKSTASFFSVFIGVILALNFSYVAAGFLDGVFNINPKFLPLFSFIMVFVIVLILISVVSNSIDKLLQNLRLSIVNKLTGGAVIAFLYAFLISTALWFVNKAGLVTNNVKVESITYPWVEPVSRKTVAVLGDWIPGLSNVFESFEYMVSDKQEPKNNLTY